MAYMASLARAAPVRAPPSRDAARGTRVASRAHRAVARGRASVSPRAGWSDFTDAVKREVELTFNPRTRGAKIAGRCPDTQEIPTEVGRAEEQRLLEETSDESFDLASFTAQLEAQLAAESAATSAVEKAEEKVTAELAARLAEVTDSYGSSGASLGSLNATDVEGDFTGGVKTGTVSKTERQQELERAYYGSGYEGEGPLSGRELALLCFKKYGVYHDMAVKHVRMGEGMKRWVSLNLYVGHLGQRSYPATEETYVEQMDAIAYMITKWGQADYCRAFFREPPIARRGLPSRPRVDTCVTLQFNRSPTWDDELGDEYFTY